jgi:Holliday junction DNA helicase RuvB
LKWCGDLAKANCVNVINDKLVGKAMQMKGIDNLGMDSADRKYIQVLQNNTKPLGLMTICAMTGLSRETVEKQIEPYLFKLGMIDKTPKGRVLL